MLLPVNIRSYLPQFKTGTHLTLCIQIRLNAKIVGKMFGIKGLSFYLALIDLTL
ncbi:MAG: hypothetical protein ACI9LX_000995 [Paraglaciecola sp.]|jgi:hypothetical protein